MTKIFHVSEFLSGLSISLMFLAIGISRLMVAFLSERVKHVNLIFVASISSAVMLAAALLSNNFILALVFFFLSMFASGGNSQPLSSLPTVCFRSIPERCFL